MGIAVLDYMWWKLESKKEEKREEIQNLFASPGIEQAL